MKNGDGGGVRKKNGGACDYEFFSGFPSVNFFLKFGNLTEKNYRRNIRLTGKFDVRLFAQHSVSVLFAKP